MKIIKFIMVVGLCTYCLLLSAQDKYFYTQYGADINQNGRDILVDDEGMITICGNRISGETQKWDSFILEIDKFGSLINHIVYEETDFDTHYRTILVNEGSGYTLFADVIYPNDYPENIEGSIRMLKIDENLIIDTSFFFTNSLYTNTDVNTAIETDNGYIVSGFSYNTGSFWQPYLVMIDDAGNFLWELLIEDYDLNNGLQGIFLDESTQTIYCSGTVEASIFEDEANTLFLSVNLSGEIVTQSVINTPSFEDFGGDIIGLNGAFYVLSNNSTFAL